MEHKTTRILIFSTAYFPYIGGAEIAIKGITDNLRDEEYVFDLITARMDRALPEHEVIGKVNVFRIGKGDDKDKLRLPFAGLKLAKALHAKNNYDLVFASMASYGGWAAMRFKKTYPKVPFLLNIQEGRNFAKLENPFRHYFFKRILSAADFVTTISEYLKSVALSNGVSRSKLQIIPNGVDIKNFSREFSYGELSELSDKLGVRPDEKVIISTSRFAAKNGIADLIQALSILANNWQGLRYKLVLAGSGKLKDLLQNLTHKLGITKDVIFVGDITHEELPKYLRISDVFVRPSLSEGLGNSFLEAMACGVPVIGTPVGGIPDFLTEGETGLFCEVGNPHSIAEKVNLILGDEKMYGRIIGKAYKLVKEKYNWKTIAQEYKTVFEELTTAK